MTEKIALNEMVVEVVQPCCKSHSYIDEWCHVQLKQAVLEFISKWEPLMGVKVEQLFMRKMKTRWGSCNPRSRRIRLNTELAKKSLGCLEYVVVHEMVHLLEPTHNRRFKALMDQFLPKWRSYRQELNGKTPATEARQIKYIFYDII